MTIFDGVAIKPTLSPTMQGVLSMVTLVANSLLAADKVREERQTGEGVPPAAGTLNEVMAQAGLDLPGLDQMLERLMGGGEEARKAATLIMKNPDPAGLLQRFVEHFGHEGAANAAPVASGPAVWTAPAAPSHVPVSGPPTFRPDFTRQGRAAARTAATNSPTTPPAGRSSTAVPTVETQARARVPIVVSAPGRSSLVVMVEHQLGLMRHRMGVHEVELDRRLTRAEAELVALRKERDELIAMRVTVGKANGPLETQTRGASFDPGEASTVPVSRGLDPTSMTDARVATTSDRAALDESDCTHPLPAASDDEALQAVRLIAEFGDDMEALQGRQLARVVAVEEEIVAMRLSVQREREALGLMEPHG